MKRVFKIVGISLIGLVLLALLFLSSMNRGMGDIQKMAINDVSLARLSDGTYTGQFTQGRWSYKVTVAVSGNRMESIDVQEPQNQDLNEMNQTIIQRVLDKQSLLVDVVSGATVNSKALLKAIENAVSK